MFNCLAVCPIYPPAVCQCMRSLIVKIKKHSNQFTMPLLFCVILPVVFGLFVIFDAIARVQNALDLRRCGYDSWKGFLLLPVLSVVLGVVLIVNPFGAMETLVMAIGIILIVEGAINLLSALYTVLALRRFAKLHPETQSMLEDLTGEDLNGDGVVAPEVTRTDAEATAVELDHVDESATVDQEDRE